MKMNEDNERLLDEAAKLIKELEEDLRETEEPPSHPGHHRTLNQRHTRPAGMENLQVLLYEIPFDVP